MAYHETALDAIFEDRIYDAELEEGEMTEEDEMDVDAYDGQSVGAEEGQVLVIEPSSTAFLDEPVEQKAVELGECNDHLANGESGQSKDLGRPPRQRKSNKKRSGKRAKSVNVVQFVRDTCNHLQEKKYPLVWAAVKKLGVDAVRNLIKEVDVIERCGGQMTNDGKRRRTPGGVMWNILRGRVQPDVYKEIMSQGNEVQKQKDKKAKESLKRNRMDVDVEEPVNNKRQKVTAKEVHMSLSVPPGKQIKQSQQSLRPAKGLLHRIEGPQRDNSSLPGTHLQKAWVEGVRKKDNGNEAAAVPVFSNGAELEVLDVGTVTAGLLEKKPVPVFERLRVPVQYSDLVCEKKPELSSQEQMVPIEESHLVEGILSDLGRQDLEQNGE